MSSSTRHQVILMLFFALAIPGIVRTTFSGGDVVVRVMQKSVVIRSLGGPTLTFIDGDGARRCIVMPAFTSNSNGVLLDEFTLLNGKTPDHGGNGRVKFLVLFSLHLGSSVRGIV